MQGICEKEMAYESGFSQKRPIALVRGKGARVWDAQGREYIDCIGGHGVAIVGHANPEVALAIAEQASRLMVCPSSFCSDMRAELLETLIGIAPSGLARAFLCNSGAEAVEAALKIARLLTGRRRLVAAMRGFHGRTMGALSVTWRREYRAPFEPLVPEVHFVPYGDLAAMEEALAGGETAAVILEVVQGEGGVIPGKGEYLRGVQALCRKYGALFIVDEVQTGFGRTGRMFACQHHGLEPDLLCLAKGIAGGVPMGAVLIHERLGRMPPRKHGSTFGGSPLACAAALAAIRFIQKERLPQRAAELGAYFMERLRGIESPAVREVRGLGLMVGVELREKAAPYLSALAERGILALSAGATVVRFLPPLVISREELDQVVAALSEALP
ncbi:MAG: Acetylornithine/acetyl-lysine aminotransferase [Acetothermia bacterium 64_32]|nr:MAG: Acetylornithine/acetyl-lysine aminotransferase [Acetothermia bacterium 64_32]MBC7097983.1 acetylornithine/succinylornithine family transaminase [Candidatus Bipolaricaulota bacterium]